MNAFQAQKKEDAMRFALALTGAQFKLGEHFRLVEMASKDGADEVLVHPALIVLLEAIRRHFGRPVTINSGYRSPRHNQRIGGAHDSRHVWGMAADVHVWGVGPSAVQDFADKLQVGGLGRYSTFTHVDVEGVRRRWKG